VHTFQCITCLKYVPWLSGEWCLEFQHLPLVEFPWGPGLSSIETIFAFYCWSKFCLGQSLIERLGFEAYVLVQTYCLCSVHRILLLRATFFLKDMMYYWASNCNYYSLLQSALLPIITCYYYSHYYLWLLVPVISTYYIVITIFIITYYYKFHYYSLLLIITQH